jgi:hypothetical protein
MMLPIDGIRIFRLSDNDKLIRRRSTQKALENSI